MKAGTGRASAARTTDYVAYRGGRGGEGEEGGGAQEEPCGHLGGSGSSVDQSGSKKMRSCEIFTTAHP